MDVKETVCGTLFLSELQLDNKAHERPIVPRLVPFVFPLDGQKSHVALCSRFSVHYSAQEAEERQLSLPAETEK